MGIGPKIASNLSPNFKRYPYQGRVIPKDLGFRICLPAGWRRTLLSYSGKGVEGEARRKKSYNVRPYTITIWITPKKTSSCLEYRVAVSYSPPKL